MSEPTSNIRLGRLPHDPVALASAPAHKFGASPPPAALDRSAVPFTPLLGQNDVYSNCTVVSVQNMIEAQSALSGFGQSYIDPVKALEFFATMHGNPPDLVNAGGLVYLDVMNRVAASGFDTGHDTLFGIPGTVSQDRPSIALAMEHLGGVGLGITLREADEEDWADGRMIDAKPGQDRGKVVGGHAIFGWDYLGLADDATFRAVWWGKLVPTTWRFLQQALDEAHGARWPQLGGASVAN
jgi:hypothetical protein